MVDITKLTGRLGNQMFQYAYLYSQFRKGLIPDIYVQGEEFFKDYADEIKDTFSADIVELPYVAVHVRRGDYVKNPFYVNLTQTEIDYDLGGSFKEPNYYELAMKEFPKAEFLVFSDNIEWCKDYFIGDEYKFCEEEDPILSMNLMAGCKGHIIANSSFSWWAAYISPYTQKVVAPSAKNWYTDGVERTLCPKEWKRI